MRFGFHLFMVDPAENLDLARTADECGWDCIHVPDTPFFPEVISAQVISVPHPYTPDATMEMPVLDPWIAIASMATVTKRIRFMPSVLRLAIRQPLLEAKSLCSAAAISNDRVAMGVGMAWMPEEFKWLNMEMKSRSARQDEALQIIRLLMQGGMQEFHGDYYNFDRLIMSPVPKKRIPIYVGGTTTPALRRAARFGDGSLTIIQNKEDVEGLVAELNGFRRGFGRENEPFDIMTHCPDVKTVDDIRRLEELGVTDLQVTPWSIPGILADMGVGNIKQPPPLAVKLEAIKRYADQVIAKFDR